MTNNAGESLPSALDLIGRSGAYKIHKWIAERAFVAGKQNDWYPCAAEVVERAIDPLACAADKMVARLVEDGAPDDSSARYGCMRGCPGVFLNLESSNLDASLCQKRSAQQSEEAKISLQDQTSNSAN